MCCASASFIDQFSRYFWPIVSECESHFGLLHYGNGLCTAMISVLEKWCGDQRGLFAYLQVEAENAPAFGLYQLLANKISQNYWY